MEKLNVVILFGQVIALATADVSNVEGLKSVCSTGTDSGLEILRTFANDNRKADGNLYYFDDDAKLIWCAQATVVVVSEEKVQLLSADQDGSAVTDEFALQDGYLRNMKAKIIFVQGSNDIIYMTVCTDPPPSDAIVEPSIMAFVKSDVPNLLSVLDLTSLDECITYDTNQ